MPIYEFECRGCRTRFEKLCSISSNGNGVDCPDCGGSDTKRLMSSFFARTSSGSGGSSHSCSCGGSCGGNCGSNCSGCCH